MIIHMTDPRPDRAIVVCPFCHDTGLATDLHTGVVQDDPCDLCPACNVEVILTRQGHPFFVRRIPDDPSDLTHVVTYARAHRFGVLLERIG